MSTRPSGTVTFLFTDIEGSTKLAQQYPDAIQGLLTRHHEILRQCIQAQNGYSFQNEGDSLAVAFHSPLDAVKAAINAQHLLQSEAWSPAPIKVRMGIHTGAAQLNDTTASTAYTGYTALATTARIMSAGHGGQILISNATQSVIRDELPKHVSLRDMGERRLKDLILPERIYQLNVPGLPSEFAPLKTYEHTRHNLPLQLTTFIGRKKEVGQIKQRMEKNRLVTLTGSGGIGKTRLSIQVASELLAEYPIGVWLVELTPLTDPALVPQSVCAALGVKPEGDTSALDALINYMHEKKILLVVDNCEHLIDACAQLCDSLLRACPELQIIASSREALGIEGENAYRVPSLSLPNPKSGLQVIEESEAVKLFMERATTNLPEFEMTEANAPAIAQICQRLDGIALAIELAASRVKMLKVEQIATKLDDAFRLLTGGSRTALPRQQTLRALIDWSYNLLPDEERAFLRKLSVFMGGWTLEAAEAVCGDADALELLTHLVDKSLVSVDLEHGDEPRYYLLETVRQYAREKMIEAEDSALLRDIHLEYFLKTAERIAPDLYTRKMPYWLDYLETEYANFQAALEWTQERNVEAGLRLCNALFRLWQNRGEYRKEGLGWIKKILNTSMSNRTASCAWVLYHATVLQSTLSPNWDAPESEKWLEEGLILAREFNDRLCIARILEEYGFREVNVTKNYVKAHDYLDQSMMESRLLGDNLGIGWVLDWRGRIAYYQLDFSTARLFLEESLSILSRIGELRRWGLVLTHIGYICSSQGEWNAALNYSEQALSVAQEAQSNMHIALNLGELGFLHVGMGNFKEAIIYLNQARELVQGTPDDKFLAGTLMVLGEVARFQGNFDQAITLYHESMAIFQSNERYAIAYSNLAYIEHLQGEIKRAREDFKTCLQFAQTEDDWTTASVLPCIGNFLADHNISKVAVSLLGWVDGWYKTKKVMQPPIYQTEFDGYLERARKGLSESEFNAAWAEGQSMSQEQVLARAMEVLQ